MKRKLVTFIVMLLVLVGSLFVTSCALMRNEDGSTSVCLTPATHKAIGDIGKGGVDLLSILSIFIPAIAPITAAAGAGVVTWNRMGKKVTKYKTPLEHTVSVLEALKKDKKLWAMVKPYLKGELGGTRPSGKTEATIRGLIDEKERPWTK
jgi:hypothetical protein